MTPLATLQSEFETELASLRSELETAAKAYYAAAANCADVDMPFNDDDDESRSEKDELVVRLTEMPGRFSLGEADVDLVHNIIDCMEVRSGFASAFLDACDVIDEAYPDVCPMPRASRAALEAGR